MKLSFRATTLFTVSLMLIAGCHNKRSAKIKLIVEPNLAEHTAAITCGTSSSGVCYITFAKDATPAAASIKTGETVLFSGISEATLFCSEAHQLSLGNCKQETLGWQRHTETKEFSSDAETN